MTGLPPALERQPLLDLWVRIDPAETVTVFTGKVELGQGLRTALARIGADELDVVIDRVRVETADTAHGLDEGMTAGSTSIHDSGQALRQAAAEARAYLLSRAALELGVDVEELVVEDGIVSAGESATSYWQLLGGESFGVAASGKVRPKRPPDRRVVGGDAARIDLTAIVTGTTRYIQDLALPGMLHGRTVFPPAPGAFVTEVDDEQVAGMPGVVSVVRDGSFLGVIAEREEQAIAAARALTAATRWSDPGPAPVLRLRTDAAEAFLVVDGIPIEGEVPDVEAPVGAVRTIKATYTRPHTLHAAIGPSAAVAQSSDGQMQVWSSSQGVFPLRRALASALRLEEGAVRVKHVEGPGCYGHNGADDVAFEAALLARAAGGRPVRVVYSREQEHTREPYGPAALIELQASLDADGCLLDWNHDVWSNSHAGRPSMASPGTSGLAAAWSLAESIPAPVQRPQLTYHGGIHRNADPLYAVPNRRIVKHFVPDAPLRVSSLRSLGAYANVFALESFVDEVAEAAGVDAVDFRLSYLQDERAVEIVKLAAEQIGWPGPREFGHGVGLAFARYKNLAAYAAVAVELRVDDETASIRLGRIVIAADAGEVIDPRGLANQLEGGAMQSASWTLKEGAVHAREHVPTADWASYPIITFTDVPRIDVEVISRPDEPPLGVGEATQGPTAAAIANAVYRAIGVRVRDLPITPDRIRAAAASL